LTLAINKDKEVNNHENLNNHQNQNNHQDHRYSKRRKKELHNDTVKLLNLGLVEYKLPSPSAKNEDSLTDILKNKLPSAKNEDSLSDILRNSIKDNHLCKFYGKLL